MTIEISKYYFNKDTHSELGTLANTLASNRGLQVSRWQNNSSNRTTITYMIHLGERADQSRYQKDVEFKVSEISRRGGKIYDETKMLESIIQFLKAIELEGLEYGLDDECVVCGKRAEKVNIQIFADDTKRTKLYCRNGHTTSREFNGSLNDIPPNRILIVG